MFGFLSIDDFRAKHPDKTSTVQMVASDESGQVDVRYFIGNEDMADMGNYLVSYVFVNRYVVQVRDITLPLTEEG